MQHPLKTASILKSYGAFLLCVLQMEYQLCVFKYSFFPLPTLYPRSLSLLFRAPSLKRQGETQGVVSLLNTLTLHSVDDKDGP